MHIQPDIATFVHNRRLPALRLYRRAHPDGNPRLTYERGAGHSIRSGATHGSRNVSWTKFVVPLDCLAGPWHVDPPQMK